MADTVGAILMGMALGSVMFVIGVILVALLTQKVVSHWPDLAKHVFILHHSALRSANDEMLPTACRQFAQPYGMFIAFGALGLFAHLY